MSEVRQQVEVIARHAHDRHPNAHHSNLSNDCGDLVTSVGESDVRPPFTWGKRYTSQVEPSSVRPEWASTRRICCDESSGTYAMRRVSGELVEVRGKLFGRCTVAMCRWVRVSTTSRPSRCKGSSKSQSSLDSQSLAAASQRICPLRVSVAPDGVRNAWGAVHARMSWSELRSWTSTYVPALSAYLAPSPERRNTVTPDGNVAEENGRACAIVGASKIRTDERAARDDFAHACKLNYVHACGCKSEPDPISCDPWLVPFDPFEFDPR